MEPTDSTSAQAPHKSGSRLFLVLVGIIIVLIAAFLVLRPNPSGTSPKNGSTTASPAPAPSQ